MSCIIGLRHKKKVFIGADGIASSEDGDSRPIHAVKVFRKGPYLMGFAGSIRTGQIIQRGDFELPKNPWGWPDVMREQIHEKGAMIIAGETQTQILASNFIIAHKGRLYETLCDFQMNEINEKGYTAIGSGATIALGSLFTTEGWEVTPRERIQMALYAAAEFARSVGPPYVIERL